MSYFIEIQNRCQQLWQRLYFWGTNTNSCGHECCESNQPRGIPRFLIYQSRLWKNVLLSNLGYSLTPAISKERMWFFPLFPYTNYYEKKNKQKKVTRYQDYRNEEEFIGKGREENILLKEHHIFSSLFQSTVILCQSTIFG